MLAHKCYSHRHFRNSDVGFAFITTIVYLAHIIWFKKIHSCSRPVLVPDSAREAHDPDLSVGFRQLDILQGKLKGWRREAGEGKRKTDLTN
jgi:hypothetical protein